MVRFRTKLKNALSVDPLTAARELTLINHAQLALLA